MTRKNRFFYASIFLFFTQTYTDDICRIIRKNCPKYMDDVCRIVSTIGVGNNPNGIAITSDNRFAYVANNNNAGIMGGDTVSVIDLSTNTVVQTISDASFSEPYTVTISPDDTKVYVSNSNGTTMSIIDIETNTVIGTIGGFDGPSGMAITPDGKTGYVNNYGATPGVGSGNGTIVNVVNLTTNTITGAITVDQAPAGLAISPDGAYVYVINYVDGNPFTGTINIIETSTNTVVGRIRGFFGPFGIAITPNGNYAYVTNFGSNNFSPTSGGVAPNVVSGTTVSKVNLKTNTIEATFRLGNQPSGVAISPDGRFVYVTNYNTFYQGPNFTNLTPGKGTLNIISVCTDQISRQELTMGASPANIAISPDGKRAYVTNYSSNNVKVINIVDNAWLNVCC